MVYVTHDQVEAMTMGNRIVVMNDGYIQQADEPMHIYNKPANRFVAGFIGTPPMNLLNAEIKGGKVVLHETPFDISDDTVKKMADKELSRITVGIRPQDFEITKEAVDGAAFESVVDLIELLGAEAFVHGRIGDTHFVAQANPALHLSIGDKVWLTAPTDKLSYFHPDTGLAL
jgi:multiple sugar transport system ATP-binding protein